MIILFENKQYKLRAGINDDGDLFFGNEDSGYNLEDNPDNRIVIETDFKQEVARLKRMQIGGRISLAF